MASVFELEVLLLLRETPSTSMSPEDLVRLTDLDLADATRC